MNDPTDTSPSKGQQMIAAYRAARLSQRPTFRSSLHETHVARRMARAQGHVRPEPASSPPVDPPSPVSMEVPAPETDDAGSIFANLISIAVSERQTEARLADTAPVAETQPDEPPVPEAAPAIDHETADTDATGHDVAGPTAPVAETAPADDPPLAEIGFGPGMLIRLSQLGVNTTGELALANPAELRAALGEISRLVDVETWISNARQKAGSARGSTAS